MVDKQEEDWTRMDPIGRISANSKANHNFKIRPRYFESVDKYMEAKNHDIKRKQLIGDE